MSSAYIYFSFSGLFIALVSAFLGYFVLVRNPKNIVNRTFFFFCFSIVVWSGAYVFWPLAKTAGGTLLAFQALHLGACFIPIAYFHFVVHWLDIYDKKKLIVYLGYITSVAVALTIPTHLFISRMAPKFSMRFWADPGPLYYSYLALFFGLFIYSSCLLYQGYRHETGVKRQQIRYVLIGIVLGFIGGSTNYFLWFNINIPPYGNILAASFVIFTAYAIMRYRFMDLRHVMRIALIYFIDAVLVYAFFYGLVAAYDIFLGSVWNPLTYFIGIFIAPTFVYGLLNINQLIIKLVDKYFFYSLYDYRRTIIKLTSELNNYNDLDKIIDLIVDTIKRTMGLNRAGVLLINREGAEVRYKIAKVIGFDVTNGISLVKDNFLTRHLKKTAKPLVREELPFIAESSISPAERNGYLNLEKAMEHIEASLCLPLIGNGELKGIIVLGAKVSGDPFTTEDLELLSTLSNQAGIAIDNARLYAESKNFNKLLQKKVSEQTRELSARAEHLEKLLKMREEFLDIASHQLKTPISVIRGTLSMFRDGSMNKLSVEEQRKFLDNIYHKTEKLNVIIADILRASEIDSEDFKINPKTAQKVRVEDILQSIYNDLKDLARDKGLKLELNLPAKPTPLILTSVDFLEQAFYNLVDNAIKYTDKGTVKIDLAASGGEAIIKVSDNGIGIPEADQKKMFEKFSRAKNAVNMYTDGSGLGLFIVKRIIEAHPGGSIGFESQEGRGTTFTIRLKTAK